MQMMKVGRVKQSENLNAVIIAMDDTDSYFIEEFWGDRIDSEQRHVTYRISGRDIKAKYESKISRRPEKSDLCVGDFFGTDIVNGKVVMHYIQGIYVPLGM